MTKEILVAVIASIVTATVLWLAGIIGRLPGRILVPSGAVVAFNAEECPSQGWQEYKEAYGRFIRGIDNSEKKIDPAGERKPGTYQEDTIQEHQHTRKYHQSNTTGSRQHPNFEYQSNDGNTLFTTTHIINARVSNETRPKNVALLYCEKT